MNIRDLKSNANALPTSDLQRIKGGKSEPPPFGAEYLSKEPPPFGAEY